MLFEVEGTDVKIIGAIHFLPATNSSLPASYMSAIASSDEVVFESDVENPKFPEIARLHGSSLASHIPSGLYARASILWTSLHIDESMDLFKPWFVALRLSTAIQISAGADVSRGVDRQLAQHARELGKPRFVLEGIEALEYLDQAPPAEVVRLLDSIVSDPKAVITRFELLVRAWRQSDFTLLDEVFLPFVQHFPVTHTRLLSDRNRAWLPSFLKAVSEKRNAVFVIGCAHIKHGENCCENLLRQQSLVLRQVA